MVFLMGWGVEVREGRSPTKRSGPRTRCENFRPGRYSIE